MAEPSTTITGRPRLVAFAVVLSGAMVMATCVNAVVSVLAPLIVRDLGLDRAGVGLVVTVVAGGGAVLSLVAGSLADRLGGRRMVLGVYAAGAAALALVAVSRGLAGLVGAALVCSLANGAANPATNTLIAGRIPPGRRGITTGIKQSGVYAGVLLWGVALPPLAAVVGWRGAVWAALVVPVTLTLLLLAVVAPDPPSQGGWRAAPARFRASPTVVWMTVYGLLMGMGAGAMMAFIPLYAEEAVGFSVQAAGLVAGSFGLLGVVARIVWASASEHLDDYARPLGVLALLSAVATVLIVAADPTRSWLLVVGALLAGSTLTAWNAVVQLAVVVKADGGQTGRASGLINAGFLGGLGLAPVVFGWAVDRWGSYDLAWSGVVVALLVATATTVVWRRQETAARPRRGAG